MPLYLSRKIISMSSTQINELLGTFDYFWTAKDYIYSFRSSCETCDKEFSRRICLEIGKFDLENRPALGDESVDCCLILF